MPESVQQYEIAAAERLYDALAIALTDGRQESRGSAYLFGYVIEMVLKSAFFRLIGWNAVNPVDFRRVAEAVGRRRLSGQELHDLSLWQAALLAERQARQRALPDPLASELATRLERVGRAWRVDHRYDGTPLPRGDVEQMFDDASWFFAHRLALAQ